MAGETLALPVAVDDEVDRPEIEEGATPQHLVVAEPLLDFLRLRVDETSQVDDVHAPVVTDDAEVRRRDRGALAVKEATRQRATNERAARLPPPQTVRQALQPSSVTAGNTGSR